MNKDFITQTQYCQRNWDTTKSIPQEHIDFFSDVARLCPSKQNYAFYNLKFITDRNTIEQIHDATGANGKIHSDHIPDHHLTLGFGVRLDRTQPTGPGNIKSYTNPQTLANLLVVYGYSIPYEKQKSLKDKFGHFNYAFQRDADMAIGISLGYLYYVAHSLGYKTGGCACLTKPDVRDILNEDEDYLPAVMLGIGFPDENRNSREHHTDPTFTFPQKPKEEIKIEFI